jgi:hypothetical protein
MPDDERRPPTRIALAYVIALLLPILTSLAPRTGT